MVSLGVLVEVHKCRELHLAPQERAEVGFLARVGAHVGLEISFFKKGLLATLEGTDEVAHASMFLQVNLKALVNRKTLEAPLHGANELLHVLVGLQVAVEVPSRNECFCATNKVAGKKALILTLLFCEFLRVFYSGSLRCARTHRFCGSRGSSRSTCCSRASHTHCHKPRCFPARSRPARSSTPPCSSC